MSRLKIIAKVIKIKEHTKEVQENELKKARDLVELEREHLVSLERKFQDSTEAFATRQEQRSVSTAEMELLYGYMMDLCKDMEIRKGELARKTGEMDERARELLETHKEKRRFEILETRLINEKNRQAELKSQKEMDFLFLSKKGKIE